MRYFILVVFIIVSCKTTSKNSQAQSETSQQEIFEEVGREVSDARVSIRFKNTSEMGQSILNPMKKQIERNINGEWEKVSVLYCDCGGPPCPAPPNETPVEASGTFIFSWNLMVEECATDQNGGRSTVKEKAFKGDYRAICRFRPEGGGEIQNIVINFAID